MAATILELGEYHGELVHDDAAGTVTVYILDGAAAENVPVDAKEAVINITREGLAKQFTLAASPVEGEPEGWSSRFVSSDAELAKELDNEGTGGRVRGHDQWRAASRAWSSITTTMTTITAT